MAALRECFYTEKGSTETTYYFHQWIQEGGELSTGGTIDAGAILEHVSSGRVIKVWDITNIRFKSQ